MAKKFVCKLLKKISDARRAWTVNVYVKRDREIRTNTSHKHDSCEAIERNDEADESFSAAG